jgi:UDP-N-acetyl-D-glucosamine dehydrogenase
MRIVIVGMGYVGLPLALEFSKSGLTVTGFDIDSKKVKKIQEGVSHIEDISAEFLSGQLAVGNLTISDQEEVISSADVVIIAVPTPLTEIGKPDLSYLETASKTIGRNLKKPALIINESTSFPGTLRTIISTLVEQGTTFSERNLYAVAPERVDPGNKNWNIKNTPRLIGGLTAESVKLAFDLYSIIVDQIILVESAEIAEGAKLFENTFRQVNIALVNEFAEIMSALQIPARKVLEAANTKPYGFMGFEPGIGVGGHCIPVDPSYLSYVAGKAGVNAAFIELANQVNNDMPKKIIKFVTKKVNYSLVGKRILVCGISYKPDVADLRESPAIEIMSELENIGANVSYYDPLVPNFKGKISVDLFTNTFELAIITVAHKNLDIRSILDSAELTLDATGKFKNLLQVI